MNKETLGKIAGRRERERERKDEQLSSLSDQQIRVASISGGLAPCVMVCKMTVQFYMERNTGFYGKIDLSCNG